MGLCMMSNRKGGSEQPSSAKTLSKNSFIDWLMHWMLLYGTGEAARTDLTDCQRFWVLMT